MKIESSEKDILESVERGEWQSSGGGKRQRSLRALRQGDIPQGPPAEHSPVE